MKIRYEKLFKQPDFENQRIGLEVEIDDNKIAGITKKKWDEVINGAFDDLQKKVYELANRSEKNIEKMDEMIEEEQDKIQKEQRKKELEKELEGLEND